MLMSKYRVLELSVLLWGMKGNSTSEAFTQFVVIYPSLHFVG